MFTKKDFHLTDENYNFLERWAESHKCDCRNESCCGGEISVTFTPTTIGTHISAKCVCGQEIVVEDL